MIKHFGRLPAALAAVWLLARPAVGTPTVPATVTPPTSLTFPFSRLATGGTVYGLPLMRVRVGDTMAGTFLFDTGTNISLVTDALAGKLGLHPTPTFRDGHRFTVEGRPASSVIASRLRIGPLLLQNVPLIVISRRRLVSVAQHPLDGIIGMNVWRQFPVLLDFRQQQITVWRPGELTADALSAAGFADVAPVPIQDPDGQFLFTTEASLKNGALQGQEDLLIDTGAERTTLSHRVAVELSLKATGKPAPANFLAGSYPALAATLTMIQIGSASLSPLLVGYPVGDVKARRLLGADFLSKFSVLLDFPGQKMYLRPVKGKS